jgi:hypothetical protein
MEQQQSIQWRRDKVQELSSQGSSQREIARILQVGTGTINRDLSFLRQQAKSNIKRYIDERLPEEYEKCLVGLTSILREAWNTSQQAEDRREKIQALSLAKECYSMKLDLLTNGENLKKDDRSIRQQQIIGSQDSSSKENSVSNNTDTKTTNEVF